jgi:hypothetical protein
MVKQANPATTTIVSSADMKADVGTTVMKDAEPLSGLNMQLKRSMMRLASQLTRVIVGIYFRRNV